MSLGYSAYQAMQGIIASFANPADFSQLYTGIAVIEIISGLSGKFFFAALFSRVLKSPSKQLLGFPIEFSAVSSNLGYLFGTLLLLTDCF
jgi:hypothetical protein